MLRYNTSIVVVIAALVAGAVALPVVAGRMGVESVGSERSREPRWRPGGYRGTSVNRNGNFNRNTNVNVNRNVNVNMENNNRDGYYGGYGGCCCHPVATAAATTAAVAVTAAAVGSIVHSIPPSCTNVVINGLAYAQCGNTWYQPQLSGSPTTYVVVNAPR